MIQRSSKTYWRKTFLFLILFGAMFAGEAFAEQDQSDQVERKFQFIDKVSNGTELYNNGKYEQALAIFQELDRTDRDLDEDGYVGKTIGDCLMELNRKEEARQAYATVLQLHPNLESVINERMIKLDLGGEVTDELINRLRAQLEGKGDSSTLCLLGYALQKRACTLLGDAITAYKKAKESDGLLNGCHVDRSPLEDIKEDLQEITDQGDIEWIRHPAMRIPEIMQKADQGGKVWARQQDGTWNIQIKDKPAVKVQLKMTDKGEIKVVAGGKDLPLTEDMQNQLRHRLNQMGRVLLDAVEKNK